MYVALLGARTIVAATANINPRAIRIKDLIDRAIAAYVAAKPREPADEEMADADGT
jgi:hypothetical protein